MLHELGDVNTNTKQGASKDDKTEHLYTKSRKEDTGLCLSTNGFLHERAAHVHVEVHDPEGDEGKEDRGTKPDIFHVTFFRKIETRTQPSKH